LQSGGTLLVEHCTCNSQIVGFESSLGTTAQWI